jgi:cell wall assembly regulator SMI1
MRPQRAAKEMASLLGRISAWLLQNAPTVSRVLRPPAHSRDIARVEKALGVSLPAEVVAAYGIHDGVVGTLSGANAFILDQEWLSLDAMLRNWRICNAELLDDGKPTSRDRFIENDPVRVVWWSPKWIPLAAHAGGDLLCLDLTPTRVGRAGQIVRFMHDDDRRPVVASSFRALMASFLEDLQAGRYEVWVKRGAPQLRRRRESRPRRKLRGRR